MWSVGIHYHRGFISLELGNRFVKAAEDRFKTQGIYLVRTGSYITKANLYGLAKAFACIQDYISSTKKVVFCCLVIIVICGEKAVFRAEATWASRLKLPLQQLYSGSAFYLFKFGKIYSH